MKAQGAGKPYVTPTLEGPKELYRTPRLLDMQELGEDLEVCTRGGEDPFEVPPPEEATASPEEDEAAVSGVSGVSGVKEPQLKHAIVVV